tara:strand:+ start:1137 stop:1385 length:249 start_codon:yes stop_codon:yes gene_type:complete
MLNPEQVAEIRVWASPLSGIHPGMATRMLADLLSDRAEIAAELERIRRFVLDPENYEIHAADALTALIDTLTASPRWPLPPK